MTSAGPMLERLERVLKRHEPGGDMHRHQKELGEVGYVLLGRSLSACIEDARGVGADERTESLLREHVEAWEGGVKYARGWFSRWRLEQEEEERTGQ